MTQKPVAHPISCVFAHDHIFIKSGNAFASRSSFPESVLARYANAFGELHVLCRSSSESASRLSPITDSRIHFHPIPNIRTPTGLRHACTAYSQINDLVVRSDLVIARVPSTIGWIAARAARRNSKPLAVEVVGNALEASMHHGSWIGCLVGPLEHMLCKIAVKCAPMAIYITRDYLQKVYPTSGRAFVCPNVYLEESVPSSAVVCRKKPVSARWLLGLVGSLDVRYKGHDTAIAVLATLRRKLPETDLRLQFVGAGKPDRWQRLAAAAGVADRVDFVGAVPPGVAMRAWYDTVDIMLQPSRVEAQGRSIIEAMSRGLPVVASAVGGVPELISTDCLFRIDDIQGFANCIADIVVNQDRYAAVALRNIDASKHYLKSVVERQRYEAFDFLRSQLEPTT